MQSIRKIHVYHYLPYDRFKINRRSGILILVELYDLLGVLNHNIFKLHLHLFDLRLHLFLFSESSFNLFDFGLDLSYILRVFPLLGLYRTLGLRFEAGKFLLQGFKLLKQTGQFSKMLFLFSLESFPLIKIQFLNFKIFFFELVDFSIFIS